MKEIKTTKTIEEVTGYKAFDGQFFRSKEECTLYESSAEAATKQAAWHYLVAERTDYSVFGSDDWGLYVFDIPDTKAYETILHWSHLAGVCRKDQFTPEYIGKRVAFCWYDWCEPEFVPERATKEAMLAFYTKRIEDLFADKEEQAK